jgi:osmotically inducible protein OsmC
MSIEMGNLHRHGKGNGRTGWTAKSDDGQINLKLDRPVEMGGKGNGTNPEQLFCCRLCSQLHRSLEGC